MTRPAGDPAAFAAAARAELEAEFAPRRLRALASWPVEMADIRIAGIPCVDLSAPETSPSGTVLYLFGGGYVSGSPETDLPILAPLAHLTGMRIIAPRYLLAPEHPYPAAVDQMRRLYSALLARTGGINGLIGESAGGGLALTLLQMALADGHAMPDRCVLLSPWVDLTDPGLTAGTGIEDPTLTAADAIAYAHAYAAGADRSDPRISPLLAPVPAAFPPTLLTTGSRDFLRPGVLAMHSALQSAGCAASLLDMPGMWHVFEVYDEAAAAAFSLRMAAQFLTTTDP